MSHLLLLWYLSAEMHIWCDTIYAFQTIMQYKGIECVMHCVFMYSICTVYVQYVAYCQRAICNYKNYLRQKKNIWLSVRWYFFFSLSFFFFSFSFLFFNFFNFLILILFGGQQGNYDAHEYAGTQFPIHKVWWLREASQIRQTFIPLQCTCMWACRRKTTVIKKWPLDSQNVNKKGVYLGVWS